MDTERALGNHAYLVVVARQEEVGRSLSRLLENVVR